MTSVVIGDTTFWKPAEGYTEADAAPAAYATQSTNTKLPVPTTLTLAGTAAVASADTALDAFSQCDIPLDIANPSATTIVLTGRAADYGEEGFTTKPTVFEDGRAPYGTVPFYQDPYLTPLQVTLTVSGGTHQLAFTDSDMYTSGNYFQGRVLTLRVETVDTSVANTSTSTSQTVWSYKVGDTTTTLEVPEGFNDSVTLITLLRGGTFQTTYRNVTSQLVVGSTLPAGVPYYETGSAYHVHQTLVRSSMDVAEARTVFGCSVAHPKLFMEPVPMRHVLQRAHSAFSEYGDPHVPVQARVLRDTKENLLSADGDAYSSTVFASQTLTAPAIDVSVSRSDADGRLVLISGGTTYHAVAANTALRFTGFGSQSHSYNMRLKHNGQVVAVNETITWSNGDYLEAEIEQTDNGQTDYYLYADSRQPSIYVKYNDYGNHEIKTTNRYADTSYHLLLLPQLGRWNAATDESVTSGEIINLDYDLSYTVGSSPQTFTISSTALGDMMDSVTTTELSSSGTIQFTLSDVLNAQLPGNYTVHRDGAMVGRVMQVTASDIRMIGFASGWNTNLPSGTVMSVRRHGAGGCLSGAHSVEVTDSTLYPSERALVEWAWGFKPTYDIFSQEWRRTNNLQVTTDATTATDPFSITGAAYAYVDGSSSVSGQLVCSSTSSAAWAIVKSTTTHGSFSINASTGEWSLAINVESVRSHADVREHLRSKEIAVVSATAGGQTVLTRVAVEFIVHVCEVRANGTITIDDAVVAPGALPALYMVRGPVSVLEDDNHAAVVTNATKVFASTDAATVAEYHEVLQLHTHIQMDTDLPSPSLRLDEAPAGALTIQIPGGTLAVSTAPQNAPKGVFTLDGGNVALSHDLRIDFNHGTGGGDYNGADGRVVIHDLRLAAGKKIRLENWQFAVPIVLVNVYVDGTTLAGARPMVQADVTSDYFTGLDLRASYADYANGYGAVVVRREGIVDVCENIATETGLTTQMQAIVDKGVRVPITVTRSVGTRIKSLAHIVDIPDRRRLRILTDIHDDVTRFPDATIDPDQNTALGKICAAESEVVLRHANPVTPQIRAHLASTYPNLATYFDGGILPYLIEVQGNPDDGVLAAQPGERDPYLLRGARSTLYEHVDDGSGDDAASVALFRGSRGMIFSDVTSVSGDDDDNFINLAQSTENGKQRQSIGGTFSGTLIQLFEGTTVATAPPQFATPQQKTQITLAQGRTEPVGTPLLLGGETMVVRAVDADTSTLSVQRGSVEEDVDSGDAVLVLTTDEQVRYADGTGTDEDQASLLQIDALAGQVTGHVASHLDTERTSIGGASPATIIGGTSYPVAASDMRLGGTLSVRITDARGVSMRQVELVVDRLDSTACQVVQGDSVVTLSSSVALVGGVAANDGSELLDPDTGVPTDLFARIITNQADNFPVRIAQYIRWSDVRRLKNITENVIIDGQLDLSVRTREAQRASLPLGPRFLGFVYRDQRQVLHTTESTTFRDAQAIVCTTADITLEAAKGLQDSIPTVAATVLAVGSTNFAPYDRDLPREVGTYTVVVGDETRTLMVAADGTRTLNQPFSVALEVGDTITIDGNARVLSLPGVRFAMLRDTLTSCIDLNTQAMTPNLAHLVDDIEALTISDDTLLTVPQFRQARNIVHARAPAVVVRAARLEVDADTAQTNDVLVFADTYVVRDTLERLLRVDSSTIVGAVEIIVVDTQLLASDLKIVAATATTLTLAAGTRVRGTANEVLDLVQNYLERHVGLQVDVQLEGICTPTDVSSLLQIIQRDAAGDIDATVCEFRGQADAWVAVAEGFTSLFSDAVSTLSGGMTITGSTTVAQVTQLEQQFDSYFQENIRAFAYRELRDGVESLLELQTTSRRSVNLVRVDDTISITQLETKLLASDEVHITTLRADGDTRTVTRLIQSNITLQLENTRLAHAVELVESLQTILTAVTGVVVPYAPALEAGTAFGDLRFVTSLMDPETSGVRVESMIDVAAYHQIASLGVPVQVVHQTLTQARTFEDTHENVTIHYGPVTSGKILVGAPLLLGPDTTVVSLLDTQLGDGLRVEINTAVTDVHDIAAQTQLHHLHVTEPQLEVETVDVSNDGERLVSWNPVTLNKFYRASGTVGQLTKLSRDVRIRSRGLAVTGSVTTQELTRFLDSGNVEKDQQLHVESISASSIKNFLTIEPELEQVDEIILTGVVTEDDIVALHEKRPDRVVADEIRIIDAARLIRADDVLAKVKLVEFERVLVDGRVNLAVARRIGTEFGVSKVRFGDGVEATLDRWVTFDEAGVASWKDTGVQAVVTNTSGSVDIHVTDRCDVNRLIPMRTLYDTGAIFFDAGVQGPMEDLLSGVPLEYALATPVIFHSTSVVTVADVNTFHSTFEGAKLRHTLHLDRLEDDPLTLHRDRGELATWGRVYAQVHLVEHRYLAPTEHAELVGALPESLVLASQPFFVEAVDDTYFLREAPEKEVLTCTVTASSDTDVSISFAEPVTDAQASYPWTLHGAVSVAITLAASDTDKTVAIAGFEHVQAGTELLLARGNRVTGGLILTGVDTSFQVQAASVAPDTDASLFDVALGESGNVISWNAQIDDDGSHDFKVRVNDSDEMILVRIVGSRVNEGSAIYKIAPENASSSLYRGDQLRVERILTDPDSMGPEVEYTLVDATTGAVLIDTTTSETVPAVVGPADTHTLEVPKGVQLATTQVRVRVAYVDADGFAHEVDTPSLPLPLEVKQKASVEDDDVFYRVEDAATNLTEWPFSHRPVDVTITDAIASNSTLNSSPLRDLIVSCNVVTVGNEEIVHMNVARAASELRKAEGITTIGNLTLEGGSDIDVDYALGATNITIRSTTGGDLAAWNLTTGAGSTVRRVLMLGEEGRSVTLPLFQKSEHWDHESDDLGFFKVNVNCDDLNELVGLNIKQPAQDTFSLEIVGDFYPNAQQHVVLNDSEDVPDRNNVDIYNGDLRLRIVQRRDAATPTQIHVNDQGEVGFDQNSTYAAMSSISMSAEKKYVVAGRDIELRDTRLPYTPLTVPGTTVAFQDASGTWHWPLRYPNNVEIPELTSQEIDGRIFYIDNDEDAPEYSTGPDKPAAYAAYTPYFVSGQVTEAPAYEAVFDTDAGFQIYTYENTAIFSVTQLSAGTESGPVSQFRSDLTLAGAVTDTDTVWTMTHTHFVKFNDVLRFGDELVRIIDVDEDDPKITVVRGMNQTTAVAHASGDEGRHVQIVTELRIHEATATVRDLPSEQPTEPGRLRLPSGFATRKSVISAVNAQSNSIVDIFIREQVATDAETETFRTTNDHDKTQLQLCERKQLPLAALQNFGSVSCEDENRRILYVANGSSDAELQFISTLEDGGVTLYELTTAVDGGYYSTPSTVLRVAPRRTELF